MNKKMFVSLLSSVRYRLINSLYRTVVLKLSAIRLDCRVQFAKVVFKSDETFVENCS
jgi:hypothetical protein